MMMNPVTVARQAYAAVMSGQPQVIHGSAHRLMGFLLQHTPLPLGRKLCKAMLARA